MVPRETSRHGVLPSASFVLLLFCLFLGAMVTEEAKMSLSDREALVNIKADFIVPSGSPKFLKSWHLSNANCSKWRGVFCNSEGRVVKIFFFSKGLGGTLSSTIGNLSYLEELQIAEGDLTGRIPESIGKLKNLTILILAVNKITGSIPESIGNLTKLETLDLQDNDLVGRIPSSIKALRRLQILRLNINSFTGPLTIDANFTTVDLEGNYFSGPFNIRANGKPFCYVSLYTNCVFFPNAHLGCQGSQIDVDVATCAAFCHANQKVGACGGRGTCSSSGFCSCDEGYKLTRDKKYCYRA